MTSSSFFSGQSKCYGHEAARIDFHNEKYAFIANVRPNWKSLSSGSLPWHFIGWITDDRHQQNEHANADFKSESSIARHRLHHVFDFVSMCFSRNVTIRVPLQICRKKSALRHLQQATELELHQVKFSGRDHTENCSSSLLRVSS